MKSVTDDVVLDVPSSGWAVTDEMKRTPPSMLLQEDFSSTCRLACMGLLCVIYHVSSIHRVDLSGGPAGTSRW